MSFTPFGLYASLEIFSELNLVKKKDDINLKIYPYFIYYILCFLVNFCMLFRIRQSVRRNYNNFEIKSTGFIHELMDYYKETIGYYLWWLWSALQTLGLIDFLRVFNFVRDLMQVASGGFAIRFYTVILFSLHFFPIFYSIIEIFKSCHHYLIVKNNFENYSKKRGSEISANLVDSNGNLFEKYEKTVKCFQIWSYFILTLQLFAFYSFYSVWKIFLESILLKYAF
jgi:hypothetical protein